MQDLIQNRVREVVSDWMAGKPVRTLALGHPVVLVPGVKNERSHEEPHVFRQGKTFAYAIGLLGRHLKDASWPVLRSRFETISTEARREDAGDLSKAELEAAESLAWKILRVGWDAAISGFESSRYVTLKREEKPAPSEGSEP